MRRWGVLAALVLGLIGAAPTAASDEREILAPIEAARALLAEAEAALRAAERGGERRAALGEAVRAHEAALAALRGGLRALAAEDRRLTDGIAEERQRLARLIGALQSVAMAPKAAVAVHPKGVVASARAAHLLADLAPRLGVELQALGRRLDALRGVRLSQEIARAEARGTLAALQALRTEAGRSRSKSTQIGATARRALSRQAEEAAARARDLEDLSRTLRASLPQATARGPFAAQRGRLDWPVAGRITGRFGGQDPWGRTGQGITFSAPAYAQITAPWDGTIRYAGPLIDYGTVVILEPQEGWLVVFAGVGRTDRRVGETVLAGETLGDLGGPLPSSEEFLLEASGAVPQVRTSDLYLEIRQDGTALDPAPWFKIETE
ncbi:MAG: peptidoglycan DD-metalloendopeptidase family protein [Pseudomonadota bacterium]